MARSDGAMLGAPKYERVENDFYPTEPGCTISLYDYLTSVGLLQKTADVYEPACGDGAIVRVFEERGHKVFASDLYPQMDGADVKDFLTEPFMIEHEKGVRPLFVTNPPYAMPYIDGFLDRMIDLVHNDGVVASMLMRNEVDCAKSRKKFFSDCPYFFSKLVLTWRPRWIPGSTGSPRHNYSWYTWAPEARYTNGSKIAYGFR